MVVEIVMGIMVIIEMIMGIMMIIAMPIESLTVVGHGNDGVSGKVSC